MPGVRHLLAGGRPRRPGDGQAGCVAGAVGDEGEGPAAGDGAAFVGEGAAQPDGGLQFGAGPVEPAAAEGEDAQLVMEVGLVGDLPGEAGGLRAGPQGAFPGAPVEACGEGGRGGAGELHGEVAGVVVLVVLGQRGGERREDAQRGEDGVGLGAHPLGCDGGWPAHQV
ncbi:hypothetical protein GCM10020256_22720 [Streptomyces thermocoprophilus]